MSKQFTFVKIAFTLLVGFFFAFSANAQVTSSSISGVVTDASGDGLSGATVVAVHVPSGSKYGSVTDVNGRYFIPGVRVGGPYKLTASFVGYKEVTKEGFNANLGTAANVNVAMVEEGQLPLEVVDLLPM